MRVMASIRTEGRRHPNDNSRLRCYLSLARYVPYRGEGLYQDTHYGWFG